MTRRSEEITGDLETKMVSRALGEAATLSGPGEKTVLKQIGFDDILEGRGVVTHGCRDRLETDRPTAIGLEDRAQILPVQFIKSLAIDALE